MLLLYCCRLCKKYVHAVRNVGAIAAVSIAAVQSRIRIYKTHLF